MPWFYHFANVCLRIILRVLLDCHVTGLENVPGDGPLIVAISHASFLDPLMAGAFIPRDIVMMSKIENFQTPVLGTIVKLYGAFPIRRGEVDLQAMRTAIDVLRSGGALLMAPEGTRSKDGRLQKGHDGTALIAVRTGARVLPVSIWGQKEFWGNLLRLRRTKIGFVVGKSFVFKSPSRKPARHILQAMTQELMYQIAASLPAEYRGVYSDLSAATTEYLSFDNADSEGFTDGYRLPAEAPDPGAGHDRHLAVSR